MKKAMVVCFLFCLIVPISAIADQVGGGDLTFKPKGAAPVLFSHQTHVSGQNVKCSACHYHVFQMSKDSYKMDMNKITKGEFCGKCHNGQKSFDVNDKANCAKCHK
jgi:c(7)-type cytochrome triheme protein